MPNTLAQVIFNNDINRLKQICLQSPETLSNFEEMGNTHILLAIAHSRIDVALELLNFIDEDVNIHSKIDCKNTPLILANAKGWNHVDSEGLSEKPMHLVIKKLVQKKAKLDETDVHGRTALHYACLHRNLDAIKLLVEAGAAKDIKDKNGCIPLDLIFYHYERASRILSYETGAEYCNTLDQSYFHSTFDHIPLILALDFNANINAILYQASVHLKIIEIIEPIYKKIKKLIPDDLIYDPLNPYHLILIKTLRIYVCGFQEAEGIIELYDDLTAYLKINSNVSEDGPKSIIDNLLLKIEKFEKNAALLDQEEKELFKNLKAALKLLELELLENHIMVQSKTVAMPDHLVENTINQISSNTDDKGDAVGNFDKKVSISSESSETQHKQNEQGVSIVTKSEEEFNKIILEPLNIKISNLRKRANNSYFKKTNYHLAIDTALSLRNKLGAEWKAYLNQYPVDSKAYIFFKQNCKVHIEKAHKVLDNHRDWSEFLINLLLAVTLIGLIIKGIANRANNKSFFFVHKTTSEKMLDQVEEYINKGIIPLKA